MRTNQWAFVASLACIALFFIAGFGHVTPYITTATGVHPLYVVLFSSLTTLIFGVLGFKGVHNFKTLLRSMATVSITLGLSVLSIGVVFFGHLFQFT